MKTITIEEYHAILLAQNVPKIHLASKCPACGTIQSAQDLINAGCGKTFEEVENFLFFSCVGRWTHHKSPPKKKGTQVGCNWTLGGLFTIHELTVIDADGKKHARFELATPEEAQRHMKQFVAEPEALISALNKEAA